MWVDLNACITDDTRPTQLESALLPWLTINHGIAMDEGASFAYNCGSFSSYHLNHSSRRNTCRLAVPRDHIYTRPII